LPAILFVPATALRLGGPGIREAFAQNSVKHLQSQAVNFVGLQVFLAYRHDARHEIINDPLLFDHDAPWRAEVEAATKDTRPELWAGRAAFLLLLALAVRSAPD
jgi:hypothetical protein